MEELMCTYMTDGAVMPFCKGCGHSHILNKLNDALEKLQIDSKDVCLVTDIGCIGLADALFDKVHTVHTTHGRSTGFATGIAIADRVLAEKRLKTIVLIGDGGSMIGLLHIVNAALLNADLTVLVCNNFLFGMTGGQQSAHTPEEFITQTTPFGNIISPIDICGIATASKAGFVARKAATDKDLTDVMAKAIAHEGFSIIEILELCTEHATSRNEIKGNMLYKLAEKEGHDMDLLKEDSGRLEFSKKFLQDVELHRSEMKQPKLITPADDHNLTKQLGVIISGSAGEKVQSSAAMLCQAGLASGLYSTQKNDNPVTQGSGFSLSEVILSPQPVYYTGVDMADVVIVLSNDGLGELKSQGIYKRVNEDTIFIADDSLELDENPAKVIILPLRKACGGSKAALGAIDYMIRLLKPLPEKHFRSLLEARYGDYEKMFKKEFFELV